MSSAPVRGIVPHRQRRNHGKHQRHYDSIYNQDNISQILVDEPIQNSEQNNNYYKNEEIQEKRPKVNPIFLWAAQREQKIVEVRCEDYDKRNRIKLTKTAQGWRSIPRTVLTTYPIIDCVRENEIDQQNSLLITKNEEKENTSKKQSEVQQIRNKKFEASLINNEIKIAKIQKEKGSHKRKRKKNSEITKNKKQRVDSKTEELFNESIININWKMKKRRKSDKNKKKKKLCSEKTVIKIKVDNQSEIQIKEKSKKDAKVMENIKKDKEISAIEVCKKSINKSEIHLFNEKKCNNFEKLKRNQDLQPRVILEQLHLSQLPTRVHRPLIKTVNLKNNVKHIEKNNGNKDKNIVQDSVKNNKIKNSNIIECGNNDTVFNKEDWLMMLNILDSNHIPINNNENESTLIKNINQTKYCTKLDALLSSNEINSINFNLSSSDYLQNEHELIFMENKKKLEQRENIERRIGNKSLNKTIERLERSINNKKKISSLPDILNIIEYKFNKQKVNKKKCASKDKVSNIQNLITLYNPTQKLEDKEISLKKDILENSKILNTLRHTPGVSLKLSTSTRKNDTFVNTILNSKNFLPPSILPNSQIEITNKIRNTFPGISIIIPAYHHRSKTPILKTRVGLPESTVKYTKNEQCEADTSISEVRGYDSQAELIYESNNENKKKKLNSKYFNYEDTEYSKVPNLIPFKQLISKNTDARMKYSNSQYQEIGHFYEQIIEEFDLQDTSQSIKGSTSAYLKRFLPSPPCAVSCSDDAKNSLILKDTLFSLNNIDLKNYDKKELINDFNNDCNSELSNSYNISDETSIKESLIINETDINQRSKKYLQKKVKYLDIKNRGKSKPNKNVQSPFTKKYISPNYSLPAKWTANHQKIHINNGYLSNDVHYKNKEKFINKRKIQEINTGLTILDPASQLRELIKISGHLIPDPLLVPRDYLPLLAGAPLTEIPKFLITRPELRLPEALTMPELLRDPDLLVISLAHLQHVLDLGQGSTENFHHSNQLMLNIVNINNSIESVQDMKHEYQRPKLICKPIDKLMPIPMDLSNNQKLNSDSPLLRVRSGLLKQEPVVSSFTNSLDNSQLWHPFFGSQKHRQRKQLELQQQQPMSWHRTMFAS